jgi:hypothetical protein
MITARHDPDCPLCHGESIITLTLRYPAISVDPEEVPVCIPPTTKQYPCPECQPVFHGQDLVQVHGMESFMPEFLERDGYRDSIKFAVARTLTRVALKNDCIRFNEYIPEGSPLYSFHQRGELVGDMYVVKNSRRTLG